MTKNKLILTIFFLVTVTIAALAFVRKANDHMECIQTVKHTTDNKGNEVVEKEHICREKYNF